MKLDRRHFIKHSSASILLPAFLQGFGLSTKYSFNQLADLFSEESDKVLVIIYLRGGNDGLNTVIPLDQLSNLNAVRPDVILPESSLLRLSDSEVAFHPSMREMRDLYEDGRLSIVQNVGYPEQNFSHFRSTDIWMSGSGSDKTYLSGWLGRYLNNEHPSYPNGYPNKNHSDPLAVEIGWSNSLLFQGERTNMSYVINNPKEFYELVDKKDSVTPDTRAGEKIDYIKLIARQSQAYGQAIKEAASKSKNIIEYPKKNRLARQLKIVARLIAGGLKSKLYLVDLGGFDTHDNQVNSNDHTQGEHAVLLRKLSTGIDAFMKDCDALGIRQRVTGMTFSEFGRRVISNASYGTDHGAAAPMFLFGDDVQGGILGDNPIIPSNADRTFNLQHQYDFRQVYQSVIGQLFCATSSQKKASLHDHYTELPLIKESVCGISSSVNHPRSASSPTVAYPNPTMNSVTVDHGSRDRRIIEVYDIMGRILHKGASTGKRTRIDLGTYPSGTYTITMKGFHSGTQSVRVVKE